jgi:hypothetical protein
MDLLYKSDPVEFLTSFRIVQALSTSATSVLVSIAIPQISTAADRTSISIKTLDCQSNQGIEGPCSDIAV